MLSGVVMLFIFSHVMIIFSLCALQMIVWRAVIRLCRTLTTAVLTMMQEWNVCLLFAVLKKLSVKWLIGHATGCGDHSRQELGYESEQQWLCCTWSKQSLMTLIPTWSEQPWLWISPRQVKKWSSFYMAYWLGDYWLPFISIIFLIRLFYTAKIFMRGILILVDWIC